MDKLLDTPFSYKENKEGTMCVCYQHTLVRDYKDQKAINCLNIVNQADVKQQMTLVNLTGNFRRGNSKNSNQ